MFTSTVNAYREFASNNISIANTEIRNLWTQAYKYIYNANAIIEGVRQSKSLSPAVKKQLEGEALVIRSFCYFYLVHLFGDVPLVITTDYTLNASIGRTSGHVVMQQIINDLLISYTLLSDYYVSAANAPSAERLRPNRFVAAALLSRVYLYEKNYVEAKEYASIIIEKSSVFSLAVQPDVVFDKGSKEAIWQMQPVATTNNLVLQEAFWLIPIGSARPNSVVSPPLLALFDSVDKRKSQWLKTTTINSQAFVYPFKYKVKGAANTSEWYMILRLAEIYLIRAEANAMLDNLVDGFSDLNKIKQRAGIDPVPATDKSSLLQHIEQERRKELFAEWGHRWLDLKRTGKLNDVLAPLKGTNWQVTDSLFPIPQSEIQSNPSLVQNPGY